ncbi:unnamed protein product, partial [Nesidiocoris tenuis]
MPITHGTYEVYKISAWDIPNNKVFRRAIVQGMPVPQRTFQFGQFALRFGMPRTGNTYSIIVPDSRQLLDQFTEQYSSLRDYGGPGSQLVVDKWKIDWATYLASTQDII